MTSPLFDSVPTPDVVDYDGEVWADIPGASLYQASNLGRVRSFNASHAGGTYVRQEKRRKTPIILKDKLHSSGGYRAVKVTRDDGTRWTLLVHRAVLLAHLGPPPDETWTGSHTSGDPTNNKLEALAWEPLKMNKKRQRPAGARITPSNAKITHDAVRTIRRERAAGARIIDLAKRYGVKPTAISRLLAGRTFAHVEDEAE